MPYKISGSINDSARIIVIEESGWTIESNELNSPTSYEADTLASGKKLVIARANSGEILASGDVDSIYYTPPARGVFISGVGSSGKVNIVDYITINTTGNATDLGDIGVRECPAACSNGANDRAVQGGGYISSPVQTMQYFSIGSFSSAQTFGNMTIGATRRAGTSNNTNNRGIFAAGYTAGGWSDVIDYITISSIGDAIDFGDLTTTFNDIMDAGISNGVNNRGVFGCSSLLDYITITSTGNATSFGNMSVTRTAMAAFSNHTNNRGVFTGGMAPTVSNIIDYITITTPGNAIDFGDLDIARSTAGGTSNGTNDRGVVGGGDGEGAYSYMTHMDYVTITTLSNSTDFGDLTVGRNKLCATSNA